MKRKILSVVCALSLAVSVVGTAPVADIVNVIKPITVSAGGGGEIINGYMYDFSSDTNDTFFFGFDGTQAAAKNLSFPTYGNNGEQITRISEYFCNVFKSYDVETVTIPASIKNIDDHALGFYFDGNDYVRVDSVIFYVVKGSAGEAYAKKYGFTYKYSAAEPSAPANVTGIKAAAYGRYALKISWNAVPGATGYVVYKKDYGKSWERAAVTKSTIQLIDGLSAGTSYDFTVKAYRTVNGKNYYSSGFTAYNDSTLPEIVSGFKASTNANTVNLSWKRVAGATGFVVYKYNKVAKKWERCAVTSGTSWSENNLNPGESYAFTVKAYKSKNGKNLYSPSFNNFKTSTSPAKVNFIAASNTKGSADIVWEKVSGATSYAVYYKASAGASWTRIGFVNNSTTKFTKTGLKSGSAGYFTVRAFRTYEGVSHGSAFDTKSIKIK